MGHLIPWSHCPPPANYVESPHKSRLFCFSSAVWNFPLCLGPLVFGYTLLDTYCWLFLVDYPLLGTRCLPPLVGHQVLATVVAPTVVAPLSVYFSLSYIVSHPLLAYSLFGTTYVHSTQFVSPLTVPGVHCACDTWNASKI